MVPLILRGTMGNALFNCVWSVRAFQAAAETQAVKPQSLGRESSKIQALNELRNDTATGSGVFYMARGW